MHVTDALECHISYILYILSAHYGTPNDIVAVDYSLVLFFWHIRQINAFMEPKNPIVNIEMQLNKYTCERLLSYRMCQNVLCKRIRIRYGRYVALFSPFLSIKWIARYKSIIRRNKCMCWYRVNLSKVKMEPTDFSVPPEKLIMNDQTGDEDKINQINWNVGVGKSSVRIR